MTPEGGAIERHPRRVPHSRSNIAGQLVPVCDMCDPFTRPLLEPGQIFTTKRCRPHSEAFRAKIYETYGFPSDNIIRNP